LGTVPLFTLIVFHHIIVVGLQQLSFILVAKGPSPGSPQRHPGYWQQKDKLLRIMNSWLKRHTVRKHHWGIKAILSIPLFNFIVFHHILVAGLQQLRRFTALWNLILFHGILVAVACVFPVC
jgi:hypothetical protein